jgi:hypothetical protein
VQLGDNDALGAVDDEGPGVRHQWQLTEVELLFLDVPDLAVAVLTGVEGDQPEGEPDRHRVRHPLATALVIVERQAQSDRGAADPAALDQVAVGLATARAHHLVLVRLAGLEQHPAVLAGQPQVVETLDAAAPAAPVADLVAHELQLAGVAEVGEREDRGEHRLQPAGGSLLGQQVHLQELLVGGPLDLDQVRQLDTGRILREFHPSVGGRRHLRSLLTNRDTGRQTLPAPSVFGPAQPEARGRSIVT